MGVCGGVGEGTSVGDKCGCVWWGWRGKRGGGGSWRGVSNLEGGGGGGGGTSVGGGSNLVERENLERGGFFLE